MWIDKYLGKRWTKEQDCGYWFRRIQKEQFNRDVPVICRIPAEPYKFLMQSIQLMESIKKTPEKFGWTQTNTPVTGDAALLAIRTKPHHIGIVIFIDSRLHILHAMETCGIVKSSLSTLRLNLYKIECYLKYGN